MIHSTEKVISHKVGLLNLAEQLQNVFQACVEIVRIPIQQVKPDHIGRFVGALNPLMQLTYQR